VLSCKKPYKNSFKQLIIILLAIEKKHLKTLLKTLSVVNLFEGRKKFWKKNIYVFFHQQKEQSKQEKQVRQSKKKDGGTTLIRANQENIF